MDEQAKPSATDLARKYLDAVKAEKSAYEHRDEIREQIRIREKEREAATDALKAIFPDEKTNARIIVVDRRGIYVQQRSEWSSVSVEIVEVAE